MKFATIRIALCTVLAVTGAATAGAADLTVSVVNMETTSGTLFISVYDDAEAYTTSNSDAAVLSGRGKVRGEEYKFTLHNLEPGQYAIKMFHDENDNGEMDSNMLGIPKEGYGFSRNGGRLGPASWEDAVIDLQEDMSISIKLR